MLISEVCLIISVPNNKVHVTTDAYVTMLTIFYYCVYKRVAGTRNKPMPNNGSALIGEMHLIMQLDIITKLKTT